MVFFYCVFLNVCLSLRIVKIVCYIDCIDEVCVFYGYVRYVCEDGYVFWRSGCIGGMGIFGYFGWYIVCIWGVCYGNICRWKFYYNGYK